MDRRAFAFVCLGFFLAFLFWHPHSFGAFAPYPAWIFLIIAILLFLPW
jgi:hypothetical protein